MQLHCFNSKADQLKFVLSPTYFISLLCSLLLLTSGCSFQKETVANKGMQNLTAKYNVLYNAKILLDESKANIENAHFDDYSQILSVYQEPSVSSAKSEISILDSVINKANGIVIEKAYSNYVDDAYFLIARANYLKANFFDASEFFDYVHKTYPEEKEHRQASLVGKARAQLQLQNMQEAATALDSALKYIRVEKKSVADIYATAAQLSIFKEDDTTAIKLLKKALATKANKRNKIRWRYILAQLQEKIGQEDAAYINYKSVTGSNAPFEMAFNANVNMISIEDRQEGAISNSGKRLQSLLKSDKNKDFADQIYYRIAESYRSKNRLADALSNYNLAIKSSTKNQNQKGLAYLRIGDLYFSASDYSKAKLYYDSTLSTLSPSYPLYERIKTKSANLDFLASRLKTISTEETLQALAKLPEQERLQRLANIERPFDLSNTANHLNPGANENIPNKTAGGKFYFDNSAAMSQGFSDFKVRWGNRKLEDNWRLSNKAALSLVSSLDNSDPDSFGPTEPVAGNKVGNASSPGDIPLTAEQLERSNKRILNAMYDIANFYKDDLKDQNEAIKTFESLLERFPQGDHMPAVYYNLYRLYLNSSPDRADRYKRLLVTQFRETPFAKAILDPDFNKKTDAQTAAFNEQYNEAFNLYMQKKYPQAIEIALNLERQFKSSPLGPQLAYLYALALGKTQKLPEFENALNSIIKNFPEDKLVVPLVGQHLEYIRQNRDQLMSRPTALIDFDPSAFLEDPQMLSHDNVENTNLPNTVGPSASVTNQTTVESVPEGETTTSSTSIFSLPETAEYYFVINVLDSRINLNSSRFGIGQFNRTNYKGESIKHQLKIIGNSNQLILVGPLAELSAAKEYESRILGRITEMMKIPVEKYNTFVISKDGLEKLTDSVMINAYLEFYKNSK